MPRHPPNLDYILIEKLANLGCTDYEIAYAIGYTPEHFCTLKKKDDLLREAIERGSNGIKIAIRRAQLKTAIPDDETGRPGNTTMLIWLGKQILHQSDHPESKDVNVNHSGFVDVYLNKSKEKYDKKG